jgi:hypothetical protein
MKTFQSEWRNIESLLRQQIAANEEWILYTAHAKQRMFERNISKQTVASILLHHPIHEMHHVNQYPFGDPPCKNRDPVFTIVDFERNVAVGLCLLHRRDSKGSYLEFRVITVLRFDESSRHSHE